MEQLSLCKCPLARLGVEDKSQKSSMVADKQRRLAMIWLELRTGHAQGQWILAQVTQVAQMARVVNLPTAVSLGYAACHMLGSIYRNISCSAYEKGTKHPAYGLNYHFLVSIINGW